MKRSFSDLPFGQIHYRTAGCGRPLLLLHGSPGSSRQLVPLISGLGEFFHVIAPDTPGFGDSAPLPQPQPCIEDFARAILAFLDAIDIEKVDIYGTHTGASIAVDLAILAPERVGRVIIDGIGIFTPEEQMNLLEHYAHPFTPDLDGAYLMRAFQFCRDQYLFFPWFERTRAARRDAGLRPAGELHAWLVEVLKAAETYHLGYRAAFNWKGSERLPLLTQHCLLMSAEDDPLRACTAAAVAKIGASRFMALPRYDDPGFREQRLEAIKMFLGMS